MVERTVDRYLATSDHTVNEKRCCVLDPACGSGVFLVRALQSILGRYADPDGYIRDRNKINDLIRENIYGVDLNEEAADVTIFSLYVTLFDFQDVKTLTDFRLPLLKNTNILAGDFFDDEITRPIRGMHFDFILGNPPWGRMKQDNYKKYCRYRNIKVPDGEISVAFLEKVRELGDEDTECSMVIPSKLLYKRKKLSQDFRKRMLVETQLERVLELSAVRKQIFKNATAPAAVLSFRCRKCAPNHKIEYISLKPNQFLKLYGVLVIESDDVKYVHQSWLLRDDYLWKILVYGSYWDYELIRDLKTECQSIAEVIEKNHLIMAKGIEKHRGEEKDSSHLKGRKIIDSQKAINHFDFDSGAYTIFQKELVHRPRSLEIFEAPYVLFRKGLDISDYSIKAAYVKDNVLYGDSISCIKGNSSTENILLNLCGLLNSSVFAYFNLMLGSSTGIEREQAFLDEIKEYPYVYSDELVEIVRNINEASSREEKEQMREKLNQCVLKMYHLEDNSFVEYALNICIPVLRGTFREKKCDVDILKRYEAVFMENWNRHFGDSGVYVQVLIYPNIKGKFAAMQVSMLFEKPEIESCVVENADVNLEILADFALYQLNDHFYQSKDVVEYSGSSFIIIKQADAKKWHPSMAVRDSHNVINGILLGRLSNGSK